MSAAFNQDASFARLQGEHADPLLIPVEGPSPDGEEYLFTARQNLRPAIRNLSLLAVREAQRLRRAAGSRNSIQARKTGNRCEHDSVIRTPTRTRAGVRAGNGEGCPTAEGDLLQLAFGEKSHGLTVGREEGVFCTLAAGDRRRFEAADRAYVKLPAATAVRNIHQAGGVRSKGYLSAKPGRQPVARWKRYHEAHNWPRYGPPPA